MFGLTGRTGRKGGDRGQAASGILTRLTNRRSAKQKLALAAALTVLVAILFPVAPALAGVGISVAPEFPTTVEVGDDDVPASLTITNNSDGDEAVGNVTVTDITFVPSCSRAVSSDPTCSVPPSVRDPETFTLSTTGVGQAGTACAGQTFTIQETSPGLYTFTSTGGPVVLGSPDLGTDTDMCRILFTFDVNKVPNVDQQPANPGVQTAQLATVDAIHENGTPGGGFGADTTTVLAAVTAINTVATPGQELGGPISDTATLSGGGDGPGAPTGTITFNLYGPNDATCAGAPVFTSVVPVNGNGDYTSAPFVPTAPGTYRWTADYSGDANNVAATSGCNAANEITQVIDIIIVKEADPASMPAPGGDFTFSLVITNPSAVPVTITSLDDDIYGDIAAIPEPNTCNDLIGTTLAPGASTAPCTFVGNFTGGIGDSQTDTVTVVATDPDTGATATDDDPATVTLTAPGEPAIAVEKTADPLQQVVPGGDFTFTVVVTNTGPVPITITSLDDDIYGDIGGTTNPDVEPNTCDELIGDTLAVGESSAPCTFVGEFTNPTPASQTDTVTVVGTDQFGRTATDDDDATVELILPGEPQIQVVKTAAPPSQEAPGGDFTFTVVVSNPGAIPVTITSLDDDVYGDIGGTTNPNVEPNTCDELIGDVLAPGASSAPCTFVGEFTGAAGDEQTDVVTVVGTDQFGRTVTDDDDAVVELTPAPPPDILVDKSVVPPSQAVPGGDFTFTVIVTNTGPRPITITTLDDDIYGDLGGAANPAVEPNTCDELIGDVLAPGESATCTFVGEFTNATPASQTDVVTVVGTDATGATATDDDDAVVTLFQPEAPQIDLVKTADPLTRFVPGGTFTFTVVVSNPGTVVPVTITTLTDDIYGDLATRPGVNTCDDLIGDVLAPGGSVTCSFEGEFTNATPATQTDIVTVTGTGNGQTVTADDDATVALIPVPAVAILVDKTATPLSRLVPGGDFTFQVIVTNPGTIPITITSLNDDVYGDLATLPDPNTCDALIGTVLAPGASSAPCTFTRPFTNPTPASQTDIVTVVGTGPQGQTATDDDDATVSLTPRPTPLVQVDKTVTPGSRIEPGGAFTFSVVVSNPGTVPVVITSLVDDVYGNLATRAEPNTCDDLIGDTIAPGASTAPCTFTVQFTGVAGDSETDTVTVVVVDEFGQTATDNDDAVITLTPRPVGTLSIDVDKTATPETRPEPGGTFTFHVVVTNTSDVPLTITALTDDIYGNLATRSGVNTCDDLIGDILAAGASASCSFEGTFTGNGGDRQTDVVEVTGRDEDGRTVTDDDDARVELTDVLPQINVVKTAVPLERTAPGGSFTFTVEVRNPGTEPIELTELTDDIYGDLDGKGTCDTGGIIAAGATYRCEFTVEFTGSAGQSQTDVVTAKGEDDDGNEVEDTDDAIIKIVAPPAATPTPSPTPTKSPAPSPVPTKPAPPLVRTGMDFLPFFSLALALISAGLVMRTRRPANGSGRRRG